MITAEEIAELAPDYEEYNSAEDPDSPSALRARLIFYADCKRIYERETEETRKKWALDAYVAAFIIEELNLHLSRRQSKYPTI